MICILYIFSSELFFIYISSKTERNLVLSNVITESIKYMTLYKIFMKHLKAKGKPINSPINANYN